jgi:hypothetical protein
MVEVLGLDGREIRHALVSVGRMREGRRMRGVRMLMVLRLLRNGDDPLVLNRSRLV